MKVWKMHTKHRSIKRDKALKAKPFGKRRSKSGKTYTERRPNRADRRKYL